MFVAIKKMAGFLVEINTRLGVPRIGGTPAQASVPLTYHYPIHEVARRKGEEYLYTLVGH